ncbi:hypothetical protein GCM10027403_14870 [Arthrobacter tecti]
MSEPVFRPLGNGNVGPTPRANLALARLHQLDPLTDLTKLSEALDSASVALAERAVQQQETRHVLDQLRSQRRNRKLKGTN